MVTFNIKLIERLCNLFELVGIILVLLMALFFQFGLGELPCPLCLLQRVGFLCIAFGFLLNFRFGFRASHYSIVILSGLFTSFVALRQISLHVMPSSPGYGAPFLGLHLYTWCFIIAMAIVFFTTLLLSISTLNTRPGNGKWKPLRNLLFGCLSLVIIVNLVSVILMCGFKECPSDPVHYELIESPKTT